MIYTIIVPVQVFLLLAEHLAQWCTSASFPELSHPIALQIQQVATPSLLCFPAAPCYASLF